MTIFHVIKYGAINPLVTSQEADPRIPLNVWILLRGWFIQEGHGLILEEKYSYYQKKKKENLNKFLLNYDGEI